MEEADATALHPDPPIPRNNTDVVVHAGAAVSPPDDGDAEQYYVHQHQIDHNLVLHGRRTFILLNPSWSQPHHVIELERAIPSATASSASQRNSFR